MAPRPPGPALYNSNGYTKAKGADSPSCRRIGKHSAKLVEQMVNTLKLLVKKVVVIIIIIVVVAVSHISISSSSVIVI